MVEVKFCEKCLSKFVVDKTGICPYCEGKGLPGVELESKSEAKPEVKVEGRGR